MRICICGGGGLGHTCAGVLSNRKDTTVDILTNRPKQWNHQFVVNIPDGKPLTGKIEIISDKAEDVIPLADIVFLCLPAFLVEKVILEIKLYLKKDTIVGAVFGCTGFFLFAHQHLPSYTKLFALQRVPYISRVVEYGKEANLLGYRDKLILAVENLDEREAFRKQFEKLFGEETELADSFYEVTLSNSNPILHTGRLYTMWKDWDGKPFDRRILFYREWSLEASLLEIEMDKEFFALLKALNVSTKHIKTLLEHYEATDAAGMTQKLRSIEALSTIQAPMKKIEGGWIPDFSSRYYTEDFPYGLAIIHRLAHEKGVPSLSIDMVYDWGTKMLNRYSQ